MLKPYFLSTYKNVSMQKGYIEVWKKYMMNNIKHFEADFLLWVLSFFKIPLKYLVKVLDYFS